MIPILGCEWISTTTIRTFPVVELSRKKRSLFTVWPEQAVLNIGLSMVTAVDLRSQLQQSHPDSRSKLSFSYFACLGPAI